MAGLLSRVKIWVDDETLTNEDLNNEFDNILNNFISSEMEGASTVNNVFNLTAAQQTVNPSPISGSNYASSVKDEILRLRYMIKSITGEASYEDAPDISLASLVSASSQAISLNTFNIFANAVSSAVAGAYTQAAGVAFQKSCLTSGDSTNKKFGEASLVIGGGINNAFQQFFKNTSGKLSFGLWVRNAQAGSIIATIPVINAQLSCTLGGFAKFSFTSATAENSSKKSVVSITGTTSILGLNWINIVVSIDATPASGSRLANLYVNGVAEGTQVSNGTFTLIDAIGSISLGSSLLGYSSGEYDPNTNVPSAKVASMFSAAPTGFSVSGTITNVASAYNIFTASSSSMSVSVPQVSLTSATVNTYVKLVMVVTSISDNSSTTSSATGFRLQVRQDASDRSFTVSFTTQGVAISDFGDASVIFVPLDTTVIHEYVIKVLGGIVYLFVDNEFAAQLTISASDTTSGDLCSIGFSSTSSGSVSVFQFENYTSSSEVFTPNPSSYNIDDLFFLDQHLTSSSLFLSQIQNQSVSVFSGGEIKHYEPNLYVTSFYSSAALPTSAGSLLQQNYAVDGVSDYEFKYLATFSRSAGSCTVTARARINNVGNSDVASLTSGQALSSASTAGANAVANISIMRQVSIMSPGFFTATVVGASDSANTVVAAGSNVFSIVPIRKR